MKGQDNGEFALLFTIPARSCRQRTARGGEDQHSLPYPSCEISLELGTVLATCATACGSPHFLSLSERARLNRLHWGGRTDGQSADRTERRTNDRRRERTARWRVQRAGALRDGRTMDDGCRGPQRRPQVVRRKPVPMLRHGGFDLSILSPYYGVQEIVKRFPALVFSPFNRPRIRYMTRFAKPTGKRWKADGPSLGILPQGNSSSFHPNFRARKSDSERL